MSTQLKIAIAEPSDIIRNGLETLLKRMPGFRISLTMVATTELLIEALHTHIPDILIINPSMPGCLSFQHLKEETSDYDMKYVALLYSVADPALLRPYDEQINIYDTAEVIYHKLENLISAQMETNTADEEQQTLSTREKEIVVCVVKGMTNREIADRLFLSTHTVITHRRNIARKLQIHSASGLTVYAIVNKLVELSDIKTT